MSEDESYEAELSRRSALKAIGGLAAVPAVGSTLVRADDGVEELSDEEKKRAKALIRRIENSPNPDKQIEQLTEEQRELLARATAINELSVEQQRSEGADVGTMASGCKKVHTKVVGKSYLGKQWTYHLETEWCYDGSEITGDPYNRRWGELHTSFWSFKGHIDKTERGGQGEYSYEFWTQGEFQSSFAGTQTDAAYPWIEHDVYADGSYDSDGDFGDM